MALRILNLGTSESKWSALLPGPFVSSVREVPIIHWTYEKEHKAELRNAISNPTALVSL
jgi:hypothetical protein